MQSVIIQHLPSLIVVVIGAVFLIVGLSLGASDRKFLRESFVTTGTITKYWSEDGHSVIWLGRM